MDCDGSPPKRKGGYPRKRPLVTFRCIPVRELSHCLSPVMPLRLFPSTDGETGEVSGRIPLHAGGQVDAPGETQHPSRVHQGIVLAMSNLLFHYGNK